MNILSIGNSFSQDAQRYLHKIAKSDNTEITAVNLYIGGCSLYEHYINMLNENRIYSFEYNGESTGLFVSIREALSSRNWDVITLQQASRDSFTYDAYEPYLAELYAYVKKFVPKAKVYMHQTWAYQDDSNLLKLRTKYANFHEMFLDVKDAYFKAADAVSAYGIIPSGELVDTMYSAGISNVQRDPAHVSLGVGRYALGLLWYSLLTGRDIAQIDFREFDEAVSEEEIQIVKNCVSKTLTKYIGVNK